MLEIQIQSPFGTWHIYQKTDEDRAIKLTKELQETGHTIKVIKANHEK